MKQVIILFAAMLATIGVFAKTADNFNSRSQAALSHLKGYLQNHGWQFSDFDVNRNGWNPGIEGDGAMVSGAGASPIENTGIYSPLLNVDGHIGISFSYRFNSAVADRRWVNIYLTDGDNIIVGKLDSLELTGAAANTTYTYNKTFDAGTRGYHVYIQYRGTGGNHPIAIDQLGFDMPTSYATGRNKAPVAANDNITGNADRSAAGSVSGNDYDADNGSVLSYQLKTSSADGKVVLNTDGSFTFTPNAGFSGTSTSFTYVACDNGSPALCSAPATATISFPLIQAQLPGSITDLGAAYTDNKVQVKWTTAFESNNDRFEIERSTDGASFKTVGNVKGQDNSGTEHSYAFEDDVKRNTITKNDLYYRLKQVDNNGKAAYSKILVVRVYQSKSLQSVSVTPNPAVNDIRVNVQLNENSFIVTKVMNDSGAEIMRKASRGNTGANSFAMEGSSQLQAGVYFLEVIINSHEHMMVKLVKS